MICRSTIKLYKQVILNVYTYILYSVITTQGSVSMEATQHRVLFGSLLTHATYSLSASVPAPCSAKMSRSGAIAKDFPCRSSLPLFSCFFKIPLMI